MDDAREFNDRDIALYRALLPMPGATLTEVAEFLGRSADELHKSLIALSEMGLVGTEDDEHYTAISPMLAEATVLGAEGLELGARRAALETRRNALRQLVPAWNAALSPSLREPEVDIISGHNAVANALMHYAGNCESELLSVSPTLLPPVGVDGRARVAYLQSLLRGITVRMLYPRGALGERAGRRQLRELADTGARIRVAGGVPTWGVVVDRRIALLPVSTEAPVWHCLAVVRQPSVVAWVSSNFEQLWAAAEPLTDFLPEQRETPEFDHTLAAILRLMGEGEKDEAISRRLSISVRTCRRHIADYMARVGATSRFQAGVIAAAAGHTGPPKGSFAGPVQPVKPQLPVTIQLPV